ncbi:hypothetical protein GQX73_g6591 [Xylaria multiplex]|uniref:Uncharacterized protein n=1 Tax=Xylaria multiplex TaxID=323545 RepID=A0A7C8MKE1_9PEZI|nr:hypothetical protein GQX73_g6591 [Xylaria multiplex]
MSLLFFCNDDDQQTPHALGVVETAEIVAGLGELPHVGESDNGPASQTTSASLGTSTPPRQLQASSVVSPLVGLYDEGSWTAWT